MKWLFVFGVFFALIGNSFYTYSLVKSDAGRMVAFASGVMIAMGATMIYIAITP